MQKKKKGVKKSGLSHTQLKSSTLTAVSALSPDDKLGIFSVIRHFFQQYLGIKQTLTCEELSERMSHRNISPEVKKRCISFLNLAANEEYRPRLTSVSLKKLERDFRAIVFALCHMTEHKAKVMTKAPSGDVRSLIQSLKKPWLPASVGNETSEVKILREHLEEAYNSIEGGDLEAAEGLYLSALGVYKGMEKEGMEQWYSRITALHGTLSHTKELVSQLDKLLKMMKGPLRNSRLQDFTKRYEKALSLYSELPDSIKSSHYETLLEVRSKISK